MYKIILTTMVKIYRDNGDFLVLNRVKKDWPGITFPGGHVEPNETIDRKYCGRSGDTLSRYKKLMNNLNKS